MPSGIVLASGSIGSKPEDTLAVLEKHGYEVPKAEPAAPAEPVEPKREDFASDEEFSTAQAEFEEQQAEAEAAAQEAEEKKAAATKPHLSRIQKRIAKETAALRGEIDALKRQIAEAQPGKKPAVETPKVPEAPKRADFKSDAEFDEAMFDYRYKLRRAKEVAEQSQNALLDHNKKVMERYNTAREEIKQEEGYADWDEVVKEMGDVIVSQPVYVTVFSLEEGPRVFYYLAKHPEKLEELNAMFPEEAAREVVRLHDRLKTSKGKPGASEATPPKPKPKVLPTPVKPMAAAASASTLSAADAAKAKDFRKFKEARLAGR